MADEDASCSGDAESEEEEEDDDEGEEEDEEEDGEEDEEAEAVVLNATAHTATASPRHPPRSSRRRSAIPDDDDSDDDSEQPLSGRGAASAAAASTNGADVSNDTARQYMPLKKRGLSASTSATSSAPTADAPGTFPPRRGRRHWAPRLDDTALVSVAIAVLARLRRGGSLSSEALMPVGVAALRRQPPNVPVSPR